MHLLAPLALLFTLSVVPSLANPLSTLNQKTPIVTNSSQGIKAFAKVPTTRLLKHSFKNATLTPPLAKVLSNPYLGPYYKDPPPMRKKKGKNCKGSSMCPQVGDACQAAADLYRDDVVYKKRTSLVVAPSWSDDRCAAIFVCEDGKYGNGMSRYQIKIAFKLLWNPNKVDGQKPCKRCGSYYMENGCHVTANYCFSCDNDNWDGNGWTGV